MLGLMRQHDTIRVVADQVGTPTHAGSLAAALWDLVAGGATGIHHFTDAGVASWYDFAVAIEEEARMIGMLDASGSDFVVGAYARLRPDGGTYVPGDVQPWVAAATDPAS